MKIWQTSIGRTFFLLSFLSVFMAGILLQSMASNTIKNVKIQDTKEYLSMVANEAEYIYRTLDSNNKGFTLDDNKLYIGSKLISNDYTIIDHMKELSGAEITFFCQNMRAITTILNSHGERFINTRAIEVWEDYALKGNEYFSSNVQIDDITYFGYYKPLLDSSGAIVGMVFAGIPSASIEKAISDMLKNTIAVCIFISVLAIVIAAVATSRYIKKQTVLMDYLSEMDKEKFNHTMPKYLTRRMDEYGELSRHIEKINDSLMVLIQRDGLTMLYSRRTSMLLLRNYFAKANEHGAETFCFAIGDIDFFKKVNDTYGHSCGDEVLKFVSKILETEIADYGFAGRWGGEEFVLIFAGKIEDARKHLTLILDKIRSGYILYEGKEIKVTMTFGIAEYRAPFKLDALISQADTLLYQGKENGRNQIVG